MAEHQDEHAAIVSFGYEAGQLKKLPRAGWLLAVLAYVIAVQEGANPERAAALGLFHDFPETRTGDVPSVGKPYVRTTDPNQVIADQTAALPPGLAAHITALVAEHESAKTADATLESRCSRDADKLELLLQAREYQAQGNHLVQPYIDSMIPAISTRTGLALAKTAQDLSPSIWWDKFAAAFGTPEARDARLAF
jgi:putative hydrolase of HD superfamily